MKNSVKDKKVAKSDILPGSDTFCLLLWMTINKCTIVELAVRSPKVEGSKTVITSFKIQLWEFHSPECKCLYYRLSAYFGLRQRLAIPSTSSSRLAA